MFLAFVSLVILISSPISAMQGEQDLLTIKPCMPGAIVKIHVEDGAAVKSGDLLYVLEFMKMEISVRAPKDGFIHTISKKAGDMVTKETTIITLSDSMPTPEVLASEPNSINLLPQTTLDIPDVQKEEISPTASVDIAKKEPVHQEQAPKTEPIIKKQEHEENLEFSTKRPYPSYSNEQFSPAQEEMNVTPIDENSHTEEEPVFYANPNDPNPPKEGSNKNGYKDNLTASKSTSFIPLSLAPIETLPLHNTSIHTKLPVTQKPLEEEKFSVASAKRLLNAIESILPKPVHHFTVRSLVALENMNTLTEGDIKAWVQHHIAPQPLINTAEVTHTFPQTWREWKQILENMLGLFLIGLTSFGFTRAMKNLTQLALRMA